MKLNDHLHSNTRELSELILSVPDEVFNQKLSPEVWSVGENLEHLVRSEFGTSRLFMGETRKEPNRDTAAKIHEIETGFINRSNRYRSFGVVNPTEGSKNKEELLKRFIDARKQVAELIDTQDPDELCLKFEHPLFGHLTRREWIHFNVVHTRRHMMQIRELLTALGG